jgi:hypothetical protein
VGIRTGAVVAAVLVAGTAFAGSAQAEQRQGCGAQQVDLTTWEGRAPVSDEKMFVIRFTAKPGVSCTLAGAPVGLRFYDAGGTPLDVEVTTPGTAEPVTLDEAGPKFVYIASPGKSSPGLPAVEATFDLPSDAADTAVRVPWPSSVNGSIRTGNVMDGAS